jgi:hypothetical protein
VEPLTIKDLLYKQQLHLYGTITPNSSSISRQSISQSVSLTLRPTVSRPVSLGIKSPSGAYDQIFITVGQLRGFLMWAALSDKKTGPSFIMYNIHFTVLDLRPCPCIYIPQEQGGPVITQALGS